MADDPNLVSEVQIQGIDKSTAELKTYGDEGAAAFNKIADAADKASGTVSGSSDKIAKGLGSIADAAPKTDIVKRLTDIGAAVGDAASKPRPSGRLSGSVSLRRQLRQLHDQQTPRSMTSCSCRRSRTKV
jgi:hypothetical protein